MRWEIQPAIPTTPNNNVASVTDARGNTSNYTYDSLGNMLSYTDPLGETASFTYNSFSEPLTIKTPREHHSAHLRCQRKSDDGERPARQ